MTTSQQLRDRVIAVTGGGSGIGAAVARESIAAGARVAILDLKDADHVSDEDSAAFIRCDVTNNDTLAAAFAEIMTKFGRIDGVVASAGINGVLAPIEDLDPREWNQTIAVCLSGSFNTIHSAVRHLAGNHGAIVLISSITGTRSFATEGAAAYAAAKAGVAALAQIAAVELGRHGIRVNTVAPGAVLDTRLWDERTAIRNLDTLAHERRIDAPLVGPGTTAQDIAKLVVFLLGPHARRISGALIHIDAAQSLLGGGILKNIQPIELAPPANPQLETA